MERAVKMIELDSGQRVGMTWHMGQSVVRMRRRSSKRCHVHRGCSYTGASSSISVGKGPFDVALVEFKRSKEVAGIQEAAFQDV